MTVYVRFDDGKPKQNEEAHSWKYYVVILVGLLILIPFTLTVYTSIIKKKAKVDVLHVPNQSSVRNLHSSSFYDDYFRMKHTEEINPNFDFLLYTQLYPITACLTYFKRRFSSEKCYLPPNKEAWSIHGIWPSVNNTIGPEYCKRERFDVNALSSIRNELDANWFSCQPNGNEFFWKHEWLKHGSCAEELPVFDSELKYFSQGLEWHKSFNMNTLLESAGIRPNNTRTYCADDFITGVEAVTGYKPVIHCVFYQPKNVSLLSEIRLCFDNQKNLESCSNREKLSDCPSDGIVYPEASYIDDL